MPSRALSSLDFLWLAFVLMVVLALAFLLPVTPQDYWWYLRIGQDTLAAGAVPTVDKLSYSQAGAPMVYHSWGAAVLFYLLYQAGGLTLTVLLRGLLLAIAYALVWLIARRLGAGRIPTALVLLLAVLVSSSNWSVRPQLFAYPLFALALYLLYCWEEGQSKAVLWLPLLGFLWVNLHGSFVMLFLLAGAALVFGRGERRLLALVLGGALLATMLNPRGAGAWAYVYHSLTIASNRFSAEWHPPINEGWQMHLFFLWLLAFPLLVAFSPRKLLLLEWAWFLGFGFLALWGVRYGIWFVFLLTVQTARLLTPEQVTFPASKEPQGEHIRWRFLPWVLVGLLLLLPFPLLPGVRETWQPDAPPATENTPIAATTWLAAHPELSGPLWAEIGFASYLEFALPSRPPWMDTRFELFTVEQWEAYRAVSQARYNWQELLDKNKINLLMVSVQEQPLLLQALSVNATWCEVYRDEIAVIYRRCGGE
ncbi:MAG: hypothetical protein N2049_00755 [Anaerolineales bacterium]|nr:hypothetical protein [Anaerolineales bacterium]